MPWNAPNGAMPASYLCHTWHTLFVATLNPIAVLLLWYTAAALIICKHCCSYTVALHKLNLQPIGLSPHWDSTHRPHVKFIVPPQSLLFWAWCTVYVWGMTWSEHRYSMCIHIINLFNLSPLTEGSSMYSTNWSKIVFQRLYRFRCNIHCIKQTVRGRDG